MSAANGSKRQLERYEQPALAAEVIAHGLAFDFEECRQEMRLFAQK